MARDLEEIINDPIDPEDFKPEDLPNPEENKFDSSEIESEVSPIEDDEVDPVGDIGLEDNEFEDELDRDDNNDLPDVDELEEPDLAEPDLGEEPGKAEDFNMDIPTWTVVPQENGEIRSEHKDGYVLRARKLNAIRKNETKYAVQLFKDHRILERGTRWISNDNDPVTVLQVIADNILRRLNLIKIEEEI